MSSESRDGHVEQLRRSLGADEAFHPEFELLARYAEALADEVDREIVETHVADCAQCAAELADLVAYVQSSPNAAAQRGSTAVESSIESRHAASLHAVARRLPERWRPSRWLAAAAMLVVIAGVASFFLLRRETPMRELRIPTLAISLATSAQQLRGAATVAPSEIEPLSPVGRMLLGDRPTFEWSGPRHARYRIEVFDETFRPVASSGELTSTSWTPPDALPSGRTYVWQITATMDGETLTVPQPPAPEARFHVIDREEAAAVATLEQHEARPSTALAVAYAEAGALAEAQRELSACLAANRDAETARRYLAVVQAHAP